MALWPALERSTFPMSLHQVRCLEVSPHCTLQTFPISHESNPDYFHLEFEFEFLKKHLRRHSLALLGFLLMNCEFLHMLGKPLLVNQWADEILCPLFATPHCFSRNYKFKRGFARSLLNRELEVTINQVISINLLIEACLVRQLIRTLDQWGNFLFEFWTSMN